MDTIRELSGRKFIRDHWRRFHPRTVEYLKRNGFSANGKRNEDLSNSDTDIIDIQLGLFREVAELPIPKEEDLEISGAFLNQELTYNAAELLNRNTSYDAADFAAIAISALMKQQLYLAYTNMRDHGHSEHPRAPLAKAIIQMTISFSLWVVGAFSLAGAIENAFSHDTASSGLCLLLSMACGTFAYKKTSSQIKEIATFQSWRKLFYEDGIFFHIGTAHGLRFRFEKMVEQGIHVPTILFDLCALLHETRSESPSS